MATVKARRCRTCTALAKLLREAAPFVEVALLPGAEVKCQSWVPAGLLTRMDKAAKRVERTRRQRGKQQE